MQSWESKPQGRAQLPGARGRYRCAQGTAVFSRIPFLFLPTGTLANKVKRKDTLAIKLGNATTPQEEKIVFPRKSKEEWNEIRHQIGTTLIRYEEWRRVLRLSPWRGV